MSNSISYEGVIGLEFDSRSPKMNVNSPSSGKINGDGRVKGGCKEGEGRDRLCSSLAKMDEPRVIQNGLISISC